MCENCAKCTNKCPEKQAKVEAEFERMMLSEQCQMEMSEMVIELKKGRMIVNLTPSTDSPIEVFALSHFDGKIVPVMMGFSDGGELAFVTAIGVNQQSELILNKDPETAPLFEAETKKVVDAILAQMETDEEYIAQFRELIASGNILVVEV